MTDVKPEEGAEPLFSIKLRSGATFSPKDLDEVSGWIAREDAAWQWLEQAQKKDRQIQYIVDAQFHRRGDLRNAIANAQKAVAAGQGPNAYANAIGEPLRARYEKLHAFTVEDPAGQFIIKTAGNDPVVAAHLLWGLLDKPLQATDQPVSQHRGQVLASLYSLGYAAPPESQAAAWKEIRKRLEIEQGELRQSAAEISVSHGKLRQLIASESEKLDKERESRVEEHSKIVADHKQEMENIRKAFKTETSLRSAVIYLKEKGESHRNLAIAFGAAGVTVGTVAALAGLHIGFSVLNDEAQLGIPKIAAAAFVITLAFWLLRVLVRSLLGHMHLAQDMGARAVLVQTYIALIAEGGAIEGEDREKVISLVFRPTSDGFVRDDAAPPGWLSFLTGNR